MTGTTVFAVRCLVKAELLERIGDGPLTRAGMLPKPTALQRNPPK